MGLEWDSSAHFQVTLLDNRPQVGHAHQSPRWQYSMHITIDSETADSTHLHWLLAASNV